MPSPAARQGTIARALAALGLALVAAISCGREPTGVAGDDGRAVLVLGPLFQTSQSGSGDDVTLVKLSVYVVNTALAPGTPGRRREIATLSLDPNNTTRIIETDDDLTIRVDFPLQGPNAVYEVEGGAFDAAGTKLYNVAAVQFTEKQLGNSGGVTVSATAVYVGPGADAIRIDVSPATVTLKPGDQAQFTANVVGPGNVTIPKAPIRWSTNNPSVAFFPDERIGLLRAVGRGNTQVTVRVEETQVSGSASVTVELIPTGLVLVQGGGQTALAGDQLPQPVRVRLVSSNIPVPGATVTFSIPQTSGGLLSAVSAATDQNGEAETRWTLGGTPGTQSLTVSSPGVANLVVNATAQPRPSSVSFVSVSPSAISIGGSATVVVEVKQNGAPVTGAQVTFSVSPTGATMTPTTVTTNSSGQASASFSASSPGTYTITASSQGAQATHPVTVTAPVTQLVKVLGDAQTAARGTTFAAPFLVEARNALGQPVAGVELDFQVGGATTRITTGSNGQGGISFTVSAASATGAGTVVVTLVSNPSVMAIFSFTITP